MRNTQAGSDGAVYGDLVGRCCACPHDHNQSSLTSSSTPCMMVVVITITITNSKVPCYRPKPPGEGGCFDDQVLIDKMVMSSTMMMMIVVSIMMMMRALIALNDDTKILTETDTETFFSKTRFSETETFSETKFFQN